jgi:hypothetical protein
MQAMLARHVHSRSRHVRYAILLSAFGCAMFGAAARADAQCLPAPAWASGPVGTITDSRPTLSWAAVPGATSYTLYVLTIPEEGWAVHAVGITGTSFQPPSPLPTNHDMRWKVKGEGPCGAGGYANGATFRVSGGASCPPTVAPTLYGPSGNITNASPTFCWSAVPGAEDYVIALLFAPDDGYYVFGHADSTGDTCINLGALPVNTPMRWKIKTECNEIYGPFSPSMYFTIVQ